LRPLREVFFLPARKSFLPEEKLFLPAENRFLPEEKLFLPEIKASGGLQTGPGSGRLLHESGQKGLKWLKNRVKRGVRHRPLFLRVTPW
jgi:hypothetical protein